MNMLEMAEIKIGPNYNNAEILQTKDEFTHSVGVIFWIECKSGIIEDYKRFTPIFIRYIGDFKFITIKFEHSFYWIDFLKCHFSFQECSRNIIFKNSPLLYYNNYIILFIQSMEIRF